ncbi:MAG: hypothetical protein VX113_07640, partial [Pseudomonadota bacterium]|nr:hypothetical protein [Pseudomonadota bacterium]
TRTGTARLGRHIRGSLSEAIFDNRFGRHNRWRGNRSCSLMNGGVRACPDRHEFRQQKSAENLSFQRLVW